MTFKDEIDDADKRYWKAAQEDRETDILEACVNKIDELENDLEDANKLIMQLARRTLNDEKLIGIYDKTDRQMADGVTIADLVTDQGDRIDEIDDHADDLDAQIDILRENTESLQKQINKDPEL